MPGLRPALLPLLLAHLLAHSSEAQDLSRNRSPPTATPQPELEVHALYAHSTRFWSTINALEERGVSLIEVQNLLSERYSVPEEGFAALSVTYQAETNDRFQRFFPRGYIRTRLDTLAGGVVRNRVLPEVQGYRTTTVQVDLGLNGLPDPRPDHITDDWGIQLGSVLGIGSHESLDALALDLFPIAPIRRSTLFFWGGEFTIALKQSLGSTLRVNSWASLRPTVFHANSSASNDYDIQSTRLHVRWRTHSEWTLSWSDQTESSVLLISGQQPVPSFLLPRAWDAVHRLSFNPSVAQLIGLATALTWKNGLYTRFVRLEGGFFGGYWGAQLHARLGSAQAHVGTLGFEQSSGYRISESRVQYATLGVCFEI